MARMLAMLLDDKREQGSSVVLYKRDRTNAYGTVDFPGVAQGWTPPKRAGITVTCSWPR